MEYASYRYRTLNKDYIEFRHGGACSSVVGRKGGGQNITLAPDCAKEYILIHEVYFVFET